jgi:hypothetical protein
VYVGTLARGRFGGKVYTVVYVGLVPREGMGRLALSPSCPLALSSFRPLAQPPTPANSTQVNACGAGQCLWQADPQKTASKLVCQPKATNVRPKATNGRQQETEARAGRQTQTGQSSQTSTSQASCRQTNGLCEPLWSSDNCVTRYSWHEFVLCTQG